jgi:hypothetical protein
MIAGNEPAVRSAWDLFAFRVNALKQFDTSPNGFKRSWLALALTLPLALFGSVVIDHAQKDTTSILAVALFICVNWMLGVGGLVLFAFLARRSQWLPATVTIFNWITLWANLFLALPITLVLFGLPLDILQWLQFLIIVYFVAVQAFILWRLWGINLALASGIVLALFLIDQFSNQLFFDLTNVKPKSDIAAATNR